MTTVIYHNPRCSKSRQTLALLEKKTQDIRVVKYIETPPTASELKAILKALKIDARALLRKGEDEYKALNLSDTSLSESKIIAAIASHPKLMERPVVMREKNAVIGRPPENIQELFDQ